MLTLLAAALLVQSSDDWLPLRNGTTLTFRQKSDEKKITLRVASWRHKDAVFVLDSTEKGLVERAAGDDTVALLDGDEVALAVQTVKDGVGLFVTEVKGHFSLDLTLRLPLKDGLAYDATRVWLSCGFAAAARPHKVSAEKVTLPAGTFDTLRVESGPDAVWLAKGVGIVKRRHGTIEWELLSFEPPADAAKRWAALWKSEKAEERDRASIELRDIGAAALPALRAAAKDADRQVRDHASALLKAFPIRRQWTGDDSLVREEDLVVVRDSATWKKTWKRHSKEPLPAVDFSRLQAVAIFHGFDSGPGGQKEAFRVTGLDCSGEKPVLSVDRRRNLFSGKLNRLHGYAIVLLDRDLDALKIVRTSWNNFDPEDVVETLWDK
jgi:hypothetical protein